VEDDDEEGLVFDGLNEEAETFALLVVAVELGFLDEAGDRLVGHEGAGGQGGDGGQVKLAGVSATADEKPGDVDDEGGGGSGLGEQAAQFFIEPEDILFDQLWQ